jgi:hypothetical protein
MQVKIGKLSIAIGSKQQQNASNGTKADNLEASNIRGEVGGRRKSRRDERSTGLFRCGEKLPTISAH